jgi:signal transduction histidine kinase
MSERSARLSGVHEPLISHQLDRIIQSANMRIEQQCIHIQESAGSPWQMTSARAELDRMIQVLDKLTTNRTKFASASAEIDVDVAAVTTH